MVLFTSPCIVMMIYDLIVMADNLEGALLVGIPSILIAAVGLFLLRAGFKTPAEDQLIIDGRLERTVLHLAQKSEGRLAPAQLTMATGLSLDQAEQVLQELESKGHAYMSVTDEGLLEYAFPSLAGDGGPDELTAAIEEAASEYTLDTSGDEVQSVEQQWQSSRQSDE